MAVEIQLLGPVEVRIDGQAVDIGHARQQCVLVALVLAGRQPTSTGRLMDRVWGERPPQRARGALQSYLSRLRKVLAAAPDVAITHRLDGYRLVVDPLAVDLYRFRRLVAQATHAGTDADSAALFEQALELWRGEPLSALETPWLNAMRDDLHTERFAAELDRNDVALRLGRHADLLGDLRAAATTHPWDERLAAQHMLALYRCGRPADALDFYQKLRIRLAEELGTDPSPPLRRLYQQVLAADPALAGATPTTRAGADARAVPRQLPATSTSFTGRATELAALDRIMVTGTAAIASINGGGGMGKTWLALRWANSHAADYPDGQLYANLHGFDPTRDPVDPAVVMRGFLSALGVDAAALPPDAGAQVNLYRGMVADRRLLIVLDNARDTDSVLPLLPGTTASSVLVTSRRQLAGLVVGHGARPLPLDVLPAADAHAVLVRHLGRAPAPADEPAVEAILAHCAGLPLALAIAAARAAVRTDLPLSALAEDLRATATRLDALDAGELAVNLRAVLASSIDAVSPGSAAMFTLLGLAQGPDISLPAAASLAGLPISEARAALGELVAAHLIQEHAAARYRLHDLVRLFAVERAAAVGPDAHRRLLDFYLHTAHSAAILLSPHREPLPLEPPVTDVTLPQLPDLDAAMQWFTLEHPVLLATIAEAGTKGLDIYALRLPWTLATFFDRRGHWHDWVQAQGYAITAAERLDDWLAEAQARRLQANALSNLRWYDEARHQLHRALDLFERHQDDAGRAHVHFDIALLADRQGQPAEALRHGLLSLDFYRAVPNPLGEAIGLNAIGWYHCQLGQYREAIEYCELALDLSTKIGSAYGQANTWDSLGYAHHHLGEHARAIECYRQAISLFEGMGDRHAQAITLDHLGDSQKAAGNGPAARKTWRESLEMLDELGHPDADGIRSKLVEV